MALDLLELHEQALARTRRDVAGIGADQWDASTPCDGWTVRDVANHIVNGNFWAAELARGKTIADVGDRLDGDVLGADPLAAYDESARAADAAFRAPGAMEAPCAVSYGPVPGEVYAGHRFIDLLIHGWDLAKAIHRGWPITGQQVSLIWSGVEPILPGWVQPARSAGHQAAYQVHLGDTRPHVLCFTTGKLTTALPPGRRIDCHIGGSPEAILLILYRRLSPWRAALTGRVVAWGPRPWLAFSLTDRFYLP